MKFFSWAPPSFKKKVRLSPWYLFLSFLVSNSILSYSGLPLSAKIWIGIVGLLLPLIAAFWAAYEKHHPQRPAGSPKAAPFFSLGLARTSPPLWLWMVFLVILVLTRFYRLTAFPAWPIGDEGTFSMIAMDLNRHWSWKMLLGENQWEPLFAWLLSLFFKAIPPSLLAIRIFPGLISLLVVLGAFWAVRSWDRPWFAFVLAWATAFNFWSFTYSRLCVREGLLLLWIFLALGFLIRIWLGKKCSYSNILFLSLVLGSGFYIFTSWPLVLLIALVVSVVKIARYGSIRDKTFSFLLLFLTTGILAFPMVMARLSNGGLAHILYEYRPSTVVIQGGRYVASLFWYGFHSAPWGPDWGGFFNPVLASLLLLGFVETAYGASLSLKVLMFSAFVLLLAPGALADGFSPYRITALLPLALLFLVLGFKKLLEGRPKSVGAVLLLLWIPSMILDIHHYWDSYGKVSGSKEYANAYEILDALRQKTGPLYIFSEFNNDYDNKTLDIADYPFNAAEKPPLSISRPPWTCVITNIQYAPYFIKTFPGLQFKVLKTDKTGPDDPKPFGIFLIPTSQIPIPMLKNWRKADNIYREIDFKIKNIKPGERWAGFLDTDPGRSNRFPKDPFLTAVYWEKTGFFEFLDGNFVQATEAYRNAIRLGIPAAHLYYALGGCLKNQNRASESVKYFKKAEALSSRKGE